MGLSHHPNSRRWRGYDIDVRLTLLCENRCHETRFDLIGDGFAECAARSTGHEGLRGGSYADPYKFERGRAHTSGCTCHLRQTVQELL